MKQVILWVLPLFLIHSCKPISKISTVNTASSIVFLHEGEWYTNFKNEVFLRCLRKIYPMSLSAVIDSLDASGSANMDQLNYDEKVLHLADSLATSFSKRQEAFWTVESGKVTMNVCLSYRNSKELDSLSVLYYQKYFKKKTQK